MLLNSFAKICLFVCIAIRLSNGSGFRPLRTASQSAADDRRLYKLPENDKIDPIVHSELTTHSPKIHKPLAFDINTLDYPPIVWKGVMLLVCIIWATNFAIIKKIFEVLPSDVLDPSLYVAIRFTIAAFVMAPGAIGSFGNIGLVRNGVLVGLSVFLGYIGQSLGILTSTANKTAFFCSMNVVWVAMISSLMNRSFKRRTWAAVLLAISGAAFIELRGVVAPSMSDLWLLLQPIGFGTGYLLLEHNMKQFPSSAQAITSFKLFTISTCSLVWAAYNGHTLADLRPIFSNPIAAAGLLYTGLVTTAFAILVQSVAFKRVSSTDASIILTSEPIWASLFAVGE